MTIERRAASAPATPADLDWDRADPRSVRRVIRSGRYRGHTAGLAPGFVQGNLCILPKDWADEFLLFCQRNQKPCPLLAMSDPGDPRVPLLAEDLDLRTDVPGYRVFRNGACIEEERTDIRELWRSDLVAFVLGCSFSFEEALADAGIGIKHVVRGECVAMYRTNIDCARAGRLSGKLVVSMRPLRPRDAIYAIEITARYPRVHGAPVHIGKPEMIGVDLEHPYLGIGVTDVAEDELPVFWACGVTPQSIVAEAKPPFCITHVPGRMLITDQRNASFALS